MIEILGIKLTYETIGFLVAFVLFSLGSWREEKAIDFLIIHSHLRLAKVNVGFRCASLGQLLAGSVEV